MSTDDVESTDDAETTGDVETKGERTRRLILEAAIERFGRDGFRSTSVTDIARDAGVSGTAAYAYFDDKEALFLAAVDEDAAAVVDEGLARMEEEPPGREWQPTLILTLVESLGRHPLARRLLAGLEPDVTERVLEIPALEELRKAITERLRTGQADGSVRTDIDADLVARGLVGITLSLLMSVVQIGVDALGERANEITAVFEATLRRPGS